MKFLKALAVGTALVAGAALAQTAPTDPNAVARSELMKSIVMNIGVLGNMASGKEAHDPAKAEAARTALVEAAAKIETVFAEQGVADPYSTAKPEIWTNWDDFLVKAKAMGDAAAAVDTASAEGIGAGMTGLGATCSDCHKANRVSK